jgi:tetracycline 7-halogenase / FADH2 O2-dependent halogenase
MSNTESLQCDVLIIGASMAGSCLARQLKLRHPEMAITVIDKKREFDYGVGESMLEVFWDYAAKDLKLGHYLDTNFLSKHGLRFFFDSKEKNLSLSDMSEMGRVWDDAIPAHQINRKRFDEDLCRMNREMGIEVLMGCAARDVHLDAEGGHRVETADGRTISCKWLVDAAGFNAPVARKLDLVEPLESHQISSRWARFKNINVLDNIGTESWRERMNYKSRFLSTNHFMYEGYWFWVIPLEQDVFSIGVVWQHDKAQVEIRNEEELIAFMRQHKALAEVLGDQFEVLDFHGLKNMSRISRQFYSDQRWFLTGMSAAFLDPLFSSGSAFLTEANRMIVDLIETDMAGDREALRNKAVCYDAHSHWWLDNFLLHITGNYHGSYDLMRPLFEPMLMDWFGLILPYAMKCDWGYDPAMDYGDGSELRAMKRKMVEESPGARVHHLTGELASFLREREGLHTNNGGHFFDLKVTRGYNRHSLSRGRTLNMEAIAELHREMLELSATLCLRRMAASTGNNLSDEMLAMAVKAVVEDRLPLRETFAHFSTAPAAIASEPVAA